MYNVPKCVRPECSVARIVPAAGRAVKGGEGHFSWHHGPTNCLHSFFPATPHHLRLKITIVSKKVLLMYGFLDKRESKCCVDQYLPKHQFSYVLEV